AEVIVDIEPPHVAVAGAGDGRIRIDARDRVTNDVLVRYRLDAGSFSDWTRASRLGPIAFGDAAQIVVEAQDSEGSIGTATQPLVGGRFDGPAAGCGCGAAGGDGAPRGHLLLLLGVALAGAGARRRVRRAARGAVTAAGLVAAAGSWAGCSCGKNNTPTP